MQPSDLEAHNRARMARAEHRDLSEAKRRATSHEELRAINRAEAQRFPVGGIQGGGDPLAGIPDPPTPSKPPQSDDVPSMLRRPKPPTPAQEGKFGDQGFS